MKWFGRREPVEVEDTYERERAQRKARQKQEAQETGIWTYLASDAFEVPFHKCLMCSVPVYDPVAHLATVHGR